MATHREQRRNADDRRARFVASYLICMNARQAAIDAGYSVRTASQQGSRLLLDAKVNQMLERAKAAALIKVDISQGRVLEELARLAFSDVTDYAVDDNMNLVPATGRPASVMKAVASIKRRVRFTKDALTGEPVKEVELEFKLWDKPGSLKLAGRHVGLFPSKDKEAIQAEAEALVEALLKKARQEQAAKQAEQERMAEERPRMIDVTPPVGDGQESKETT